MATLPFLSIVTRVCRRPKLLAQNIQSVISQTCQDIEQVFLVDKLGNHRGGNILWANQQLGRYRGRAIGHYVFILDDDGMLVDTTFVAQLKAHAEKMGYPDVILLRSRSTAQTVLPPDDIWNVNWEMWARPGAWRGHAYNWVASNNWWQMAIKSYAVPHGGDWHYGMALIESGAEIVRLHGVYSARSMQRGKGRIFEENCQPDWFEQVMHQVGGTKLRHEDWRLRLWLK